MDQDQKIDCAKGYRDIVHDKLLLAEGRNSELADEFTRLEVQIAAILFAFMGFFSNYFTGSNIFGFSDIGSILIKITFVFVFFFLIMSLCFGLVHIKRKEYFWGAIITQRVSRILKWDKAVERVITFEQAQAFHEGSAKGGDLSAVYKSPSWTWIMQTISLGIAIVLTFTLLVVFLFSKPNSIINTVMKHDITQN